MLKTLKPAAVFSISTPRDISTTSAQFHPRSISDRYLNVHLLASPFLGSLSSRRIAFSRSMWNSMHCFDGVPAAGMTKAR
jgi:hypothetical protein